MGKRDKSSGKSFENKKFLRVDYLLSSNRKHMESNINSLVDSIRKGLIRKYKRNFVGTIY